MLKYNIPKQKEKTQYVYPPEAPRHTGNEIRIDNKPLLAFQ